MVMYKLSLKTIVIAVAALLVIYLAGMVIFFIATPESNRVTTPIEYSYSVKDPAFKTNSGILAGRRWVEGNDAIILSTGEEIFSSMYEDIRNARKSITKETFIYVGEDVGTTMAHELADASENGVNVHFIMDFYGSTKATTEQLNIMEKAEVQLVRWRKPSWYEVARFNHRTHRKLMVYCKFENCCFMQSLRLMNPSGSVRLIFSRTAYSYRHWWMRQTVVYISRFYFLATSSINNLRGWLLKHFGVIFSKRASKCTNISLSYITLNC